MIRAKTCFVAEGVTIDRDTGQVSAFNLLEGLQAASYPLAVQKIAFFCLWERASTDPARCLAEFSITHNGQDIARHGIDIDFEQYAHHRSTMRLDGFGLDAPGRVVFRMAISGHGTAEWTIEASAATAPGPGAAAPRHMYESQAVSMSIGKVNVHGR